MKNVCRYVLTISVFPLLCVVHATTHDVYTSDGFIKYINMVQHQWRAGRNFDKNTELSLMNLYFNSRETFKSRGLVSDFDAVLAAIPKLSNRPESSESVITTAVVTTTDNATGIVSNATSNIKDLFATPKMGAHSKTTDQHIPVQFDARHNWPLCAHTIAKIIESPLGGCFTDWATSVVGAMQDRFCIKYGTNRTFSLSQLVECCRFCNQSYCQQRSQKVAYNYFKKFGVPSGAQLDSMSSQNAEAGCRPYLNTPFENTRSCLKCPNKKYKTSFKQDLVKIHNYYKLSTDPFYIDDHVRYTSYKIKREIQQLGSVTATFNLYHDLLYYKEGIYAPVEKAKLLGQISVRVIGWGFEQGKEYWLVSNIWKKSWGIDGFTKLEAWNVKLDFESRITAGRL